jgi:hypothetical protein
MIRYALLAVVAVVAVLWLKSRQAAALRPGVYQPQPSVWTALGQFIGSGFGAWAATPAQPGKTTPAKVSADGIYSRMGNQSPTVIGNYSTAENQAIEARERELAARGVGAYVATDRPADSYGTNDVDFGW